MPSDWIKTSCRMCESPTAIHKSWNNPDPDCGACKLISGKFVDAIEISLIGKDFDVLLDTKDKLKDLIKIANHTYNDNLRKGVERSSAWRIAERELAGRIWNEKDLRKTVLLAIRHLRKQEKEDAKAALRNELRATRTVNRTRRWTG